VLIVRPAALDDAPAWAEIVTACSPYLVQDTRSTEHEMRTEPAGVRRVVAERDGEVVGVSRLHGYLDEDHATLLVMVPPAHRRHGLGAALLADQLPAARATGAESLRSIVEDDDDSRAAAAAWGFTLSRRFGMSMVDPRAVVAPDPPDGTTVVPLSSLPPRVVWHAHSAVVRDDPSGISLPMTFEEFQAEWSDPRMRPDLGRAVLLGGELAAFTMLGVAGDRAWSDMTGTLPSYRGRGLARLAKQHALAAAAAAGVTRAMAGNDDANGPMVAVNRSLGYAVFARPALGERTSSD
jgi:GNAT superfamily N-acetyltransferase